MNKIRLTVALLSLTLIIFLLADAVFGKPPAPTYLYKSVKTNQILEVKEQGNPFISIKADKPILDPKLENAKYIVIYGPGTFTLIDSLGQIITVTAPITMERVIE